eukprot:gene19107-24417_t
MNELMGPLIYLSSVEKYPVSLALKMSIGATEEVEWASVIAISVALHCIGISTLLALLPGIEAVAHERLVSRAIDPLAGAESTRMRVNQRYVQNTIEQLWLFAPGLLMLAVQARDGASMRAVVACTIVWILARWAFWI